MRGRPPKRKNERFKAPTYSNGDTKLELLTRTKRALTQSREKWSDKTAERMKILFQEEPKLKEAYDIVNGLRSIFRSKTLDKEAAKVKLHDWYETATRCSLRDHQELVCLSKKSSIAQRVLYGGHFLINDGTEILCLLQLELQPSMPEDRLSTRFSKYRLPYTSREILALVPKCLTAPRTIFTRPSGTTVRRKKF